MARPILIIANTMPGGPIIVDTVRTSGFSAILQVSDLRSQRLNEFDVAELT